MEVNSVSTSTDLASKVVQQQKPPVQPQQTVAANPPNEPNQPNKPQPASEQQTQQVQQPKPVVNTQGQTIGKNISLVA